MKPKKETYNPYFQGYIDLVPSENLLEELNTNLDFVLNILTRIPKEKEEFRYSDGKWTIKELVLHCIDCERVFQYRALAYARKDNAELPGFEEDDYVANSESSKRSLNNILEELITVRKSTITLYNSFSEEVMLRSGIANGGKLSVSAIGFIMCGHLTHHLNVLKQRYL